MSIRIAFSFRLARRECELFRVALDEHPGDTAGEGAALFATGLYDLLHGSGTDQALFTTWVDAVAELPCRQTRVLTWPLVTVFAFLAAPDQHLFLKPMVARRAAKAFAGTFEYHSAPNWHTYQSLLGFAEQIRADQHSLGPREMIDLQSFIWVQGSDEYLD